MLIRPRYTGAKFVTPSPIMNLAFAADKALDSRITFTRASSGTYFDASGVLQTASSNEPRFTHDPSTLESLGLLIEESRTNILTYSEEFDNAAWTKAGGSISSNAFDAPDGFATADKFVEDSSTGAHNISFLTGLSGVHTFSFFVRSEGRPYINVISDNQSAIPINSNIDISTGTVVTGNTTISEISNGAFRVSCVTGVCAGTSTIRIRLMTAGFASSSYTGDGTSGIYVWGAQLEQGSFPTSYIKTTSSTVTRAADSASMTGTNFSSWYNQDSGTFVVDYAATNQSLGGIIALTGGSLSTTTPLAIMDNWSGDNVRSGIIGVDFLDTSGAQTTAGQSYKTALVIKTSEYASSTNGSAVQASASTNDWYQGATAINIGTYFSSGAINPLNSTIASIAYYPKALPSYLQSLTS